MKLRRNVPTDALDVLVYAAGFCASLLLILRNDPSGWVIATTLGVAAFVRARTAMA